MTTRGFASLEGPARWTKGLLIATVVLAAVGILSGLAQVELISRAAQGIANAELTANDSRQQAIGALQLLVLVATAVAFLVWFHRAHGNLDVVSSMKRIYTPGWAVGSFFLPFLNLWWPLEAMRELWQGTMSSGSTSTPALIGWWWGLFIASNFVPILLIPLSSPETPTLPDVEIASWLQILTAGLDIPAAILAIVLVGRITRRQLEAGKVLEA